jgi:peptide/nickel transport system substrate-binding protein
VIRAIAGGSVVVLLLNSISACAPRVFSHPDRLVIGQLAEPTSLNPLLLQGPMAGEVSGLVFSRLLTADESGRLLPDLAVRVPSVANGDITRGGTTIRYHLRSGVLWQDGKPLTAADVVFTFHAVMNPQTPVPSRFGYDHVISVRAEGPLTVVVELDRPYSPILSQFFGPDSNYAILPSHLLAHYSSLARVAFDQSPIGSGPYRVVTWEHGDYIRYEASNVFYGERPRIREIVTKFIPNAQTILAQLQTGEIDATLNGDTSLYRSYTNLSGYRVLVNPIDGAGVLVENTSNAILADVRVRRAISAAIDAPQIAHLATDGVDSSVDAARALFSYADDPSVPWTRYDPVLARHLLQEAGWSGKRLTLQLGYIAGEPSEESAGLLIAQDLASVGIRAELKSFYASTAFPILMAGHFQLALLPMYAPFDPDTSWFWACAEIPPGGFNLSRYCDAVTDRLTRAGAATFDVAQRVAFYREVERRIAAAAPIDVVWRMREVDVVPASLRGYPNGEGLSGFSHIQGWYFSRS